MAVSIRSTLAGAGISGTQTSGGRGTGWLVLESRGEARTMKCLRNCWENCRVDSASATRRNCCCWGEGVSLG